MHDPIEGHVAIVTKYNCHLPDEDLVLEPHHTGAKWECAIGAIGIRQVQDARRFPCTRTISLFEDLNDPLPRIADHEQATREVEPLGTRPAGRRGNLDGPGGRPPPVLAKPERCQHRLMVLIPGRGHQLGPRRQKRSAHAGESGVRQRLEETSGFAWHISKTVHVDQPPVRSVGAHEKKVARTGESPAEAVVHGRLRRAQGPDLGPLAVVGIATDGARLALVSVLANQDLAVDHHDGAAERLAPRFGREGKEKDGNG